MIPEIILKTLCRRTDSRIVLVVMDGLGDLAGEGPTPLEAAATPNLDHLAAEGTLGLSDPISPGITPGSGPAHLSLFGYDPIKYQIGRGILEAAGIDLELKPGDVAARGNFAAADAGGKITDRRAGRLSTDDNRRLIIRLRSELKEVDGVEVILETVKEHRFVVVFRGTGLDGRVADTDPQRLGVRRLEAAPRVPEASRTARIVQGFVSRAEEILASEKPANTFLLRGFAQPPDLPSMGDLFQLNPAAVAAYPMYRGLARLVGMRILPAGEAVAEAFSVLAKNWGRNDYYFIHVKKTDSWGEDGDFENKTKVIEEVDRCLPAVVELEPDVLVVTGDHSTPCFLKAHSWHPNPFLLWSKNALRDETDAFSERQCVRGGLGRFPAVEAMPLMLAHALKLEKFGA